jgi:hypothetical protein
MSLFDALTIPLAFFLLFLVVGVVYYETAMFKSVFNSTNATMSDQSQAIYAQYLDMNTFTLDTMNYIIVGVIFMMILISLLMAAIVYAHPGYFPILIFLAAGCVVVWFALNGALDKVLAMSWLAPYFDPTLMSWFFVLKNNMYTIISVIVAALIFALFMKGGNQQGGM